MDIKSFVIPFSNLKKMAYEYCKEANNITDSTPERRRIKFEKQAKEVWDRVKEADLQVDLVFVEQSKQQEKLFPKDWIENHIEISSQPFRVCLYWLRVEEELPMEEKLSMQFLQDTICSSIILAGKEKVEKYLTEDRWGVEKIESVAPGIEDLPMECMEIWAKACMEAGVFVTVDSCGHLTPENSLFAAYIELN